MGGFFMDHKINLDLWWGQLEHLTLESSDSKFEKMTDYLSDDCIVYFGGMNAPVSFGKAEVKKDFKKTLSYWKLMKREVTNFAIKDNIVFCAMKNKLQILGVKVDDFYETEVGTFDDEGKIKRYELYCDPTPIRKIFSDVNN